MADISPTTPEHRRWHRILRGAVALLLALGLVACGGDDDGNDATPDPTAETTVIEAPPSDGASE